MSQNVLEGQKKGYGLEQPGQFYAYPQTYRELDGPEWRESFMDPAIPQVLLGNEDTRVGVRQPSLEVPPDKLHRNPQDYWSIIKPDVEAITQFRGQGDPPPLPEDPEKWEDIDWRVYMEWVATDPQQFQMLRQVYDMLDQHYRRQG
jgi:hypothetical protein